MMDFLKDAFGLGKAPTVLPGATPAPSKGHDIADLLFRSMAGAGAGMSAAEGFPTNLPMPTMRRPATPPGLGMGMGGGAAMPGRQDNIMALLKRIFGATNPVATGVQPSNQLPPTSAPQIGTGTGGLY